MLNAPRENPADSFPWPIIGVVGGVGSGKSTVAGLFGDLGCKLIVSDAVAHDALRDEAIKQALVRQCGADILGPDGQIVRSRLASMVFSDAARLGELNDLIHPYVARRRSQMLAAFAVDKGIPAVVFDSPLLAETGLFKSCTAVVFVYCGEEDRFSRVQKNKGWSAADWQKRESAQWSLDKKLEISHYVISNEADLPHAATQVNWVLACITRDFKRNQGPG